MQSVTKILFVLALMGSVLFSQESKAQFNFYNTTTCNVDILLEGGSSCGITCSSGWVSAPASTTTFVPAAGGCTGFHTLTMQIGSTRKTVTLCIAGHAQTKYNDCNPPDVTELYILNDFNGQYTVL